MVRSFLRHAMMCTLAACTAFVVESVAVPGTPADFTVTDNVFATDVEPIGCNIGKIVGGTNQTTNQLMPGAGYEPSCTRLLRRVESAGTDWFGWDAFGGVDEYELNDDSWGDGGYCRFYRIVDASGQPLDYNGGADMGDITGADHVVFLGEATIPDPGGWMSSENRVYVDRSDLGLRFGDYAYVTIMDTVITEAESHDRLSEWFRPNAGFHFWPNGWTTKLVAHDQGSLPQAFLDEDPGATCLEITATASTGTFGNWLFHDYDEGEGQYYTQLHPGAPYKVEVWLRQEGLSDPSVRFRMSESYGSQSQSTPWTVTGTWQKYTYEFTGPPWPEGDRWHPALSLEATGPGTLYVDNFIVYRNDAKHEFRPFGPYELAFDEFMSWAPAFGKKPVMRFYNASYGTHSPIERLCSDWTSSKVDFINNISATTMISVKHCLDFAYHTGAGPADRIVPHLTLSEEYSEDEWKKLVEYLGVPYDPSGDTPQSKPMAYMRYNQRGNGTPWADEFREIIVEFGNETWHNGAGGFGWHGFGRPGYVHRGGVEYGMFAHYMFDEQVGSMPEWTQYSLADKIKFCVNGGYGVGLDQYGENSIQQCDNTAVQYVSHANYIGPKWETGDTPMSAFDADGMQKTLVAGCHPDMTDEYIAMHKDLREQIAGMGIDYNHIVYEGGPSGYFLPGDGADNEVAMSQLYGKSAGMATAALDIYLYCSLMGYKHQNFFAFGSGSNWTSHTLPEMGGWHPHASWLACKMRNRYVIGDDMLSVTANTIPDYVDADDYTVPLTGCYAFKADNAYSVVLTNRKYEGTHNGHDFGDGSTPCTVHLPFDNPVQVRLYKLAHIDGSPVHPMENNYDSLMYERLTYLVFLDVIPDPIPAFADSTPVRIYQQDIDLASFSQDFVVNENTGGVTGGLPQGAAYLYVFALDSSALSVAGRSPEDLMREGTDASNGSISTSGFTTAAGGSGGASPLRSSLASMGGSAPQNVSQPMPSTGWLSATAPATPVEQPAEAVKAEDFPGPVPASLTAAVTEDVPEYDYTAKLPQSLEVAAVTASSADGRNLAANTLDRDMRSRWSPSGDSRQWIQYDLGSKQTVGSATLVWYGASRGVRQCAVEVSSDGESFTRVHEGALRGRGASTQICDFAPVTARFVRFVVTGSASQVSVYEAALHAADTEMASVE